MGSNSRKSVVEAPVLVAQICLALLLGVACSCYFKASRSRTAIPLIEADTNRRDFLATNLGRKN